MYSPTVGNLLRAEYDPLRPGHVDTVQMPAYGGYMNAYPQVAQQYDSRSVSFGVNAPQYYQQQSQDTEFSQEPTPQPEPYPEPSPEPMATGQPEYDPGSNNQFFIEQAMSEAIEGYEPSFEFPDSYADSMADMDEQFDRDLEMIVDSMWDSF